MTFNQHLSLLKESTAHVECQDDAADTGVIAEVAPSTPQGCASPTPSGTPHPPDNVNHPAHYAFSKVEVIAAIEAWGLGYHLGNAVKYIVRAVALSELMRKR